MPLGAIGAAGIVRHHPPFLPTFLPFPLTLTLRDLRECKVADGANGELQFAVGEKQFRAGAGESVFIPRKVPHVWACVGGKPGKIINVYQPAGKTEEFFRELDKYNGKPYVHEALSIDEFRRLFHDHGMDLLGPPLLGEWKVEEEGRITQIA